MIKTLITSVPPYAIARALSNAQTLLRTDLLRRCPFLLACFLVRRVAWSVREMGITATSRRKAVHYIGEKKLESIREKKLESIGKKALESLGKEEANKVDDSDECKGKEDW